MNPHSEFTNFRATVEEISIKWKWNPLCSLPLKQLMFAFLNFLTLTVSVFRYIIAHHFVSAFNAIASDESKTGGDGWNCWFQMMHWSNAKWKKRDDPWLWLRHGLLQLWLLSWFLLDSSSKARWNGLKRLSRLTLFVFSYLMESCFENLLIEILLFVFC